MTEPNPSVEPDGTDDAFGPADLGSPVADKVLALLAQPVATLDAELIDVEWTGGTLRLVVDADGGVTTERLTAVNRLVSPILDQHDPVPGRYLLEVSSPGIERTLRRPDHFARAVGEQVIVKMEAWCEPRRVKGELTAADDESIQVAANEIDGVALAANEAFTLAHDDIAKARTHFEWGPTPKKGGPKKSGTKKSGTKNKKSGPGKQKNGSKSTKPRK